MNIIEKVQSAFLDHLMKSYALSAEDCKHVVVTIIDDAEKSVFGDLATNAAMVLSKLLKKAPRDVAAHLVSSFSHEYVASLEIAGPGFINIRLTPEAFKALLLEMMEQRDQFFKPDAAAKRDSYSVEFVSANPTGPLHLGHGRGGIIGDVLGNVLRFVNHTVTKEFYINDAGSQIKKLGISFKIRCQQQLGVDVQLPEEGYQGEYLVDLAKQCIAQEGKSVIDKPDAFFADYAKNALLERLKGTLSAYGIDFDMWFSEKSLYDAHSVDKALNELTERGFTYEAEDALWFKSTQFGDDKDRVLKKSNGEYTYVASDVAYLKNKIERGAHRLILVLGQDHHSYVVRLKGIMAALGYNPDNLDVILYQLVTLKEGGEYVRMSKRAGKIVSLEDITQTVGKDIARFFYLNRKADAHLEFDIDLALKNTEENPVYYIQYAYVRTGSILQKAFENPEFQNLTNEDIQALTPAEYLLLKKIVSLKNTLEAIANNYQTHVLTYYVLELAHSFHKYYAEHRVIDVSNIAQSRARLLIIQMLRMTFETCFSILEINKPEKM